MTGSVLLGSPLVVPLELSPLVPLPPLLELPPSGSCVASGSGFAASSLLPQATAMMTRTAEARPGDKAHWAIVSPGMLAPTRAFDEREEIRTLRADIEALLLARIRRHVVAAPHVLSLMRDELSRARIAPQLRNAHAQSSEQFEMTSGVSAFEPPRRREVPGTSFFSVANSGASQKPSRSIIVGNTSRCVSGVVFSVLNVARSSSVMVPGGASSQSGMRIRHLNTVPV